MLKHRNVCEVVKTIDKKLLLVICVMFLISCVLLPCGCEEGGSAQQAEKLQSDLNEPIDNNSASHIYQQSTAVILSDNMDINHLTVASPIGGYTGVWMAFLDNVPRLNQSAIVIISLYTRLPMKGRLEIVLPDGIELVNGDIKITVNTAERESKEFRIAVKPVKAGDYTIKVIFSYPTQWELVGADHTYYLNLLITENSSKWEQGPIPSWRELPKTKGKLTPLTPGESPGRKLSPEEQTIFDKNYQENNKNYRPPAANISDNATNQSN
jgi:hypothetical protein